MTNNNFFKVPRGTQYAKAGLIVPTEDGTDIDDEKYVTIGFVDDHQMFGAFVYFSNTDGDELSLCDMVPINKDQDNDLRFSFVAEGQECELFASLIDNEYEVYLIQK